MRRRLLRFAALSLLVPALAACGGGGGGATAGQRPYTAVARFLPGDEVTVIQVTVSDRQALRGADLVGPGGTVIDAESIDARQGVDYQSSIFRPSVGGETGVAGFALPLGGFGNSAPASQTVNSGQVLSTALIRLTDPQAYVKDWQQWQIRLRIGDPPNVNVLSLAAPQPPAGL